MEVSEKIRPQDTIKLYRAAVSIMSSVMLTGCIDAMPDMTEEQENMVAEYAAGLLFNRSYAVWDYRDQPMNLHGQICLPFSLIWMPVGLGGMMLYRLLDKKILPEA